MNTRESLLGKKFGKWLVVGEELVAANTKWPKWRVKCVCECGKEQLVPRNNLLLGLTHGCHKCAQKSIAKGQTAKTQVWNYYVSNSRKRNREFSLTKEQFLELTQQPCHYCEYPPHRTLTRAYDCFTYNGIDRKDNDVGYTLENSLPCCAECNLAKGTRSYEDFITWLKRFQ